RVGDGLALGDLAHQALATLGESNHGGGGATALGVGDNDRLAALHHRYTAIGRPQVNTNDFAHCQDSFDTLDTRDTLETLSGAHGTPLLNTQHQWNSSYLDGAAGRAG